MEDSQKKTELIDYQEPFLTSEQLEENLIDQQVDDEQLEENLIKKTRFKVKKIDFTMNKDQQDGNQKNNVIDKTDSNKEERKNSTHSSVNSSQVGESESECNTQNLKSLRNYTVEPLPKAAHYRNTLSLNTHQNRPSLDELHNPVPIDHPIRKFTRSIKRRSNERITSGAVKLGWIQGVFIRCLLNIWGVMLFLRLPWVVGQGGIIQGIINDLFKQFKQSNLLKELVNLVKDHCLERGKPLIKFKNEVLDKQSDKLNKFNKSLTKLDEINNFLPVNECKEKFFWKKEYYERKKKQSNKELNKAPIIKLVNYAPISLNSLIKIIKDQQLRMKEIEKMINSAKEKANETIRFFIENENTAKLDTDIFDKLKEEFNNLN